jgi:hypothetical protein
MIKNPLSDTKIETEKMVGFYRGVVEDNNDPLKAGRVRVRIWGLHTSQKIQDDEKGIPTEHLDWAEPCLSLSEGSISGFGTWNVPLQGSHVMLFFENGNIAQPRYFATMPGIPESKESLDTNNSQDKILAGDSTSYRGFQDPNGVYPTDARIGEPDVHRLARGISNDTLVDTKNANRDLGVPTALGGSWSEPASPYNAKYPHNIVIATHGGITVEYDSTPSHTRLHFYHPSNSYIEIDNDGNMVIKNGNQKYEIVLSDNNIHIKRDRNLTIDNDSTKLVKGNSLEEISGDETRQIGGDVNETIDGNETRQIGKNVDETIDGNKNGWIKGGGDVQVDEQLNITVDGMITITGNSGVLLQGGNVEVSNPSFDPGNINLGSQSTTYFLMDERMIDVYNNHKHKDHGEGKPKNGDKLHVGVETTTVLKAS